jgi:hypothetical protein
MRINDLTEEKDFFFEMSNLRKQDTGLPVNIYVSSGGSVNNQHGPRIKAMVTSQDKMNPRETVSIMLKKDIQADDIIGYNTVSASTLAAIREYVNLNYDVLIKYWNDEISTVEMINGLKKI